MNTKGNKVELSLEVSGKKHLIYFESQQKKLNLSSESIIAATLLPFMKLGKPIDNLSEVDPKFLSSLDQIQDIFNTWDNSFTNVPIEVNSFKKESVDVAKGVGTFFTGGVDSFYTFLKHKDEITHLIYVHGYENHKITSQIQHIAEKFDKKVIEIETNLRDYSDTVADWYYYLGPALVTVGHLLKLYIGKIYIPSTHTYSVLDPIGSHPLVDPLWSSSNLKFIHDGCEATRVEKVKLISKDRKAIDALRVCWKDTGDIPNCGKCEKCIRTMLNLKAVEALDKCSNFPDKIPLRKVARMGATTEGKRAWIMENLTQLEKNGDNKKLVWALRWVLLKPNVILWIRRKLVKTLIKLQKQIRTARS